MNFTQRTIRSAPGLSQEEALEGLYSHPQFKPGTRVASIRRKGEVWVANLLEPNSKIAAGFPPDGDDDGDEEVAPKAPPKDEAVDEGPDDSDSDSKPAKPKKDGGGEGEVLKLLHVLLDALGIAPGPEGIGAGGPPPGAGGPPPGGPPPPPHGGPPGGPPGGGLPAGGGGGQPYGSKLKPGEVPNRPGNVPVGAPAFGSVKNADLGPEGLPMQPGQQPGQQPPFGQVPPGQHPGQVPPPGPPVPGQAPPMQPGMGAPLNPAAAPPTFVASTEDPQREVKLATAKKNLEGLYGDSGYKVKQIRRDGSYIRALLSNR